jgi:hypothetical protein
MAIIFPSFKVYHYSNSGFLRKSSSFKQSFEFYKLTKALARAKNLESSFSHQIVIIKAVSDMKSEIVYVTGLGL